MNSTLSDAKHQVKNTRSHWELECETFDIHFETESKETESEEAKFVNQ